MFAGGNRTVIGVMQPEFRFPDERIAFWIPFAAPRRKGHARAGSAREWWRA